MTSNLILKILLMLSTCTLGVFLGTQLAEAALIVPYWKGLSSEDFFAFYKAHGKKLQQFYAPLTIAATILPICTIVCSLLGKTKTLPLMWLMLFFSLLFFSTFFIYFKAANYNFTMQTISYEALPNELLKWEKWHWTRIFCEAVAFISGLFLLLQFKK